jgi:outer membrane protein assembly complex protein YaeT
MKAARAGAVLAGLLAAGPRAAAEPSVPALQGTTIAALSFRGDAPVDTERLAALADLRPGRRLTGGAIRSSLRNLFATRLFSDLSVEVAPSPAGAVVVVVFSASPRIARLTLTPGIPSRGRMLDAIGLGEGDPWSSEAPDEIGRSVKRILKERGYFAAKVDTLVEAGPDETSVDVRIDVQPGPRVVAAPPEWPESLGPLSAADLAKAAKLKPGKPYREKTAREDAERYAALFRAKGYSRAEVRFDGEHWDSAAQRVAPRYAVFAGPLVVLKVAGEKETAVRKHPESPWAKGEPPDEDAIQHLREALVNTYEEKGYAKANVEFTTETQPGTETVSFTIDRGTRYSVAHVTVEGVHSLRLRDVLDVLETRPRGSLETGRFVTVDAAGDRDAIANLYRSKGYRDVKVSNTEVRDGTSPFTLDVTFRVEEGVRTVVGTRTLEGTHALAKEELLPKLAVVPGRPFSESEVGDDSALLQGVYLDRGFVDSKVETVTRFREPEPPAGERADVDFAVTEGSPVTFGKTVVRGNRKTRPFIIEDRLAQKEGEPFSLTKLVETQQKLARLGVFQRIEIANFPTDEETMSRTVLVTVSEARPWGLTYAVGGEWDPNLQGDNPKKFSPRLSLGVSYNNLFGRALEAGVEGRYSTRDPRLILTVNERSLFKGNIPLSFAAYATKEYQQTYDVKRRGVFLQSELRVSQPLRLGLRYQYELVEPSSDPGLGPDQRPNQTNRISSVAGGFTYDRRNDPFNPSGGYLFGADLKFAFPLFSADAHFLKAFLQGSLYRGWRATRFAFAVRAGMIQTYSACDLSTNPTCAPNLTIPIPERLFAGGRSTHRAFPLDDLGIPGETVNSDDVGFGGNFMLIGNAEWRVPLVSGFEMSLFFDVGNVWADAKHLDLSQLRPGAGLGLHYLTPVGPLRLEYGLKLDKKINEKSGAFNFSIGYGF